MLLGLAHAEQMCHVLELDILDQKDNGFYNMSPFHNDLVLQTAAQLADATENVLYFLAGVSGTYALSCIALFFGVYKNRPGLIIPWLVVEFLLMVALGVLVFMLRDMKIVQLLGGQVPYCKLLRFLFQHLFNLIIFSPVIVCYSLICMDYCKWYVMHSFYQSLRTMNKLREIATVAIPCPAPGAVSLRSFCILTTNLIQTFQIPYHFQREHMYLGSNGYKHILTESPDGQC